MRTFFIGFLLAIGSMSQAQDAHMHAKHNMVLFGESEIFASHIVYKVPHNYQIILSLKLDSDSLQKYLSARRGHESDQFIYLLDSMDIKDIATQGSITGTVFFVDKTGQKQTIIPSLTILRENFQVIFFDELPLSLEKDSEKSLGMVTDQPLPFHIQCQASDDSWDTHLELSGDSATKGTYDLRQDKREGYTHLRFNGQLELIGDGFPKLTFQLKRRNYTPAIAVVDLSQNSVTLDGRSLSCEAH